MKPLSPCSHFIALLLLPLPAFANTPAAKYINKVLKEDTSVIITLKGSDPDHDKLSYKITRQPSHGSVELKGNKVKYTPEANYSWQDSFEYQANDGVSDSASAIVSLNIKPVNDAPVLKPQSLSVSKDAVTHVALLASDVECDTLTYKIVKKPKIGRLEVKGNLAAYTPYSPGYQGSDSFMIAVKDGKSTSKVVSVALTPDRNGEVFTSFNSEGASLCRKLNDTGSTLCGDYAFVSSGTHNNDLNCNSKDPQNDTIPPGQDALYGRDATHADDSDGYAGFSFTRLNSNGDPLDASATHWDCVKDHVTGLIWEVKTTSGLRSINNTYSWYNPDSTGNGGYAGYQNGGSCTGSNCDTYSYVQAVNAQGLCGAKDWRMPTSRELHSIVSLDRVRPSIDTVYFPETLSDFYWSSSPSPDNSGLAWIVYFYDGWSHVWGKDDPSYVRLVRVGL